MKTPFRLLPTPALATDAEISGLFRLLEQDTRTERDLVDDDNAMERIALQTDREFAEIRR